MKRLRRLFVLFLTSGIMIILSHIMLTSLPVAAHEAARGTPLNVISFPVSQTITGQDSISIQQIDAVTITFSSPVTATFAAFFTATISGGTPPIVYEWSFGDGTVTPPSLASTASHTYALPGTYTVVVTATNVAGQAVQRITIPVADPNTGPIIGLAITHSLPIFLGTPIFFTATVRTGALPITYGWDFGDGSLPAVPAAPVVSHTYTETGEFTVLVAAFNDVGPVVTQSLVLLVSTRAPSSRQLHLPIILKASAPSGPLADLHCSSLTIDPPKPDAGQSVRINVEIENQGKIQADGFWVDLYINPTTVPTSGRSNRLRWQDACGGPDSCSRGIAWAVSDDPLPAGESRSLVSIPAGFNPPDGHGFDPDSSIWPDGNLPSGTYKFYAYVDSINGITETIDGAVREENEENNRCEGDLIVPATPRKVERPASGTLPKRSTSP